MYSTIKYFASILVVVLIAFCIANPFTSELLTEKITSEQQISRQKRESFCSRNQACGWQIYDKETDELHSFEHSQFCHCRTSQKCLKGDYSSAQKKYIYKCWKPRS
uniref:CSON009187 protein n=1 Tax=Culicoides sonorensis TaxID=179676 RepID=A0A336LZL6_CULSO